MEIDESEAAQPTSKKITKKQHKDTLKRMVSALVLPLTLILLFTHPAFRMLRALRCVHDVHDMHDMHDMHPLRHAEIRST